METNVTISLSLIGLAAVAAGGLGIRLPSGDRLAAVLALVVGAGVGVISLSIGSQVVEDANEAYERVLLVASTLGFLATVASLAVLWRGVARQHR